MCGLVSILFSRIKTILQIKYYINIVKVLWNPFEVCGFGLVDHLTFSPVSAEGRLYHVISKFWKLIPLISDFGFCFVEMMQNGGRVKKFFEINVCSEMYIRVTQLFWVTISVLKLTTPSSSDCNCRFHFIEILA